MFNKPSGAEKTGSGSDNDFKQRGRLRNKILLNMVALILLFGLSSALVIRTILLGVLKTEFRQRSLSSARSIAANGVMDILTQNSSRLNKLLENEKKLEADIAYAFIIDSSGEILAHTFKKGFPVELLNANALAANNDFNAQLIDTRLGRIYDIDVPVILDKSVIGQVRMGILQIGIQKIIALIDASIAFVTLVIVLLNIFLVNKISALITGQVSRLVEAVQLIQNGDFSAKIDVKSRDEIGFLADAFNKMAAKLNHLVKEKEKLTKYKEREEIALDLHDNCAQDLANLIKRLELCEKLFKIEPVKAGEELKALQENIRGHLGKARRVIHGLKSGESEKFILAREVKNYLVDLKYYNAVNVKLNIDGSFEDNLPQENGRYIFYIITEALNNVVKHAQADNIAVSMAYNAQNELAVIIKDDGRGFEVKEGGASDSSLGQWGLLGMHQRAFALGGTVVINSTPGHGSEVRINIPVNDLNYSI